MTITEDVYNVFAGDLTLGRVLGSLGVPEDGLPAIESGTAGATATPLAGADQGTDKGGTDGPNPEKSRDSFREGLF